MYGKLAAACLCALLLARGEQVSPPAPPPNFPSLGRALVYSPAAKGLGSPASEETLADLLAKLDVRGMRGHAWDVWAALTARDRSNLPC